MLLALFVLLLTAANPAPPARDPSSWPADPTRPVVISDKDWIRRPTDAQLAEAWPAEAKKAGVDGRAVLNCEVAYDGAMEDCKVFVETPAGKGFGAAALSLSGRFQLSPMVDGQSTTGGRMLVPVRFRAPEPTE